jgi:deoxyribose-phosphate aldolase
VAAVSTGFPAGLSPFHLRVAEIGESVAAGAREIDIVISRRHVLTGNWQALYDEMREIRAACGEAHVKAILATGELGDAAQRGEGVAGLHDGGGGFHQDLDRQGERQRHAAGERW